MAICIKIMTMVMMLLYKAQIPDHNIQGFFSILHLLGLYVCCRM